MVPVPQARSSTVSTGRALLVELPRQVVCPPAVFHIHCQGIVAGGQGVITAHLSRFLYRAKIFS